MRVVTKLPSDHLTRSVSGSDSFTFGVAEGRSIESKLYFIFSVKVAVQYDGIHQFSVHLSHALFSMRTGEGFTDQASDLMDGHVALFGRSWTALSYTHDFPTVVSSISQSWRARSDVVYTFGYRDSLMEKRALTVAGPSLERPDPDTVVAPANVRFHLSTSMWVRYGVDLGTPVDSTAR